MGRTKDVNMRNRDRMDFLKMKNEKRQEMRIDRKNEKKKKQEIREKKRQSDIFPLLTRSRPKVKIFPHPKIKVIFPCASWCRRRKVNEADIPIA